MLVGDVPFMGKGVMEVYEKIQKQPVLIPDEKRAKIDPLAIDLICRMLEKVRVSLFLICGLGYFMY